MPKFMNFFTTRSWTKSHLIQIKNKAGSRYTPELNVELPISEIFDGLSRNSNFYTSIRKSFGNLSREFNRISKSSYDDQKILTLYQKYDKEIRSLLEILSYIKEYAINPIPWKDIGNHTTKSMRLTWQLLAEIRSQKEKYEQEEKATVAEARQNGVRTKADVLSSDMHYIYEVQKLLHHFNELSLSTKAKLSNRPFLLLNGIAGNGKTHLLCDVVEQRGKISPIVPSVMVFGEFFKSGNDLWAQITKQAGLKDFSKVRFLKNLNQAGWRSKCRSLLIVDALNETTPLNFWNKNLRKLLNDIKKYPHIAIVVSIRSGFEEEIISGRLKRQFIEEKHHGFEFREWEAVTKFFHEFNLELPEIPLLTPEFQNPLFLLLFCKAFGNKNKKSKKIKFRGNEGATHIFESFVKNASKKIAVQFDLPKGRSNGDYVIWDTIIKKIAIEMVDQRTDRITEETLVEIVNKAYPLINKEQFVKQLEKSLLLVKVPRYSIADHKMEGFDYRFPFQKFSDHLISRYIFKKYRASKRKPRHFFAKNTKIGKFIGKGWNRGIIEALSIQCPEQLRGVELIEIAPYLSDLRIAQDAFIESLIWRNPEAFSKDLKNIFDYINKKIVPQNGDKELLNAFLSVASVPQHPFNANFLHQHLLKISMPNRDAFWSIFLHKQFGSQGAVDRIIEWASSKQVKTHIENQSMALCCTALSWFLTSSNRFVRDRATKALVELLTDRMELIIGLLEKFKNVDDLYVIERLYAVAYGCVLRNKKDRDNLRKLALWVYDEIFKDANPPAHILLRDYARGVVEVAIKEKLLEGSKFKKIRPPYSSKFPKQVPTEESLKAKYYPEDFFQKKTEERGFLDIWSSVMYNSGHLGEFGKSDLNPAVERWSGRRFGQEDRSKSHIYNTFKKQLSKKQTEMLNKASNDFYGISFRNLPKIVFTYREYKVDEEKLKKLELERKRRRKEFFLQFEKSLPSSKKKFFTDKLKPFLDDRGGIKDPLDRFDTGLAQRWVFNRVVQLGWEPKLHGEFDQGLDYHRSDRSEYQPERIGKKYQWIALHELLARLADNFEFKEDSYSDRIMVYDGPWQLNLRDIDPSCTLTDTIEARQRIPSFNKYQSTKNKYNAWNKKKSTTYWLKTRKDLPNPIAFIEIKDDKNNVWLVLEGSIEWQEKIPPEQDKYALQRRTLWYQIKSCLVKEKDYQKVFNWTRNKNKRLPQLHAFSDVFLREFPWAPAFMHRYTPFYGREDWTKDGHREDAFPAKILLTYDEYSNSVTKNPIHVKLPAKWLADNMNLTQQYSDGRLFDKEFDLTIFDYVFNNDSARRSLLVRKDKLISFLKKKKCAILWTILGEKQTLGGGVMGQPHGWLQINGCYRLNNKGTLQGTLRCNFNKPPKRKKARKEL